MKSCPIYLHLSMYFVCITLHFICKSNPLNLGHQDISFDWVIKIGAAYGRQKLILLLKDLGLRSSEFRRVAWEIWRFSMNDFMVYVTCKL